MQLKTRFFKTVQFKIFIIITVLRLQFCISSIENDSINLVPYRSHPLFDLKSFPLHFVLFSQKFLLTELINPSELQRSNYISDKRISSGLNRSREILRFSDNFALNVLDLTSENKTSISKYLNEIKSSKFFRKTEDRFIFIIEASNQKTIQPMHPVMLEIKYKIILSVKLFENNENKNNDSAPLMSISVRNFCYFCNEQDMVIPPTSTLTLNDRIDLNIVFPLSPRNSKIDLKGRKFRISCPTNIRIRVVVHEHKNGSVTISGVYGRILHHLMKGLNFTSEYLVSTGGGTGSQLPNGTWVGGVGDVYYERADIGLVVGNKLDRFLYVGFPTAAEYQSLIIISGKHQLVLGWSLLSVPFTSAVWIMMGVIIIVATVVLIVLQRILRTLKPPKEDFILWPEGNILEGLLAAFFDEPVIDPSPHSIRLFFSTWLLFALIMSTLYRSKLFSALAYPPVEMPPRNFEDLIQSEYKWGLDRIGDASYTFMITSKNPTYQKIAKEMDVIKSSADCVRESIIRKYACISFTTVMDFVIARNFSFRIKEIIKESSYSAFTIGVGITTRKDFPLEKDLSKVMGQAVSQDLPNTWLHSFYRNVKAAKIAWVKSMKKEGKKVEGDPGSSRSDGPQKLPFEKMQGAFFGLFVGGAIGFIAFLSEMLKSKRIGNSKIRNIFTVAKSVVRFRRLKQPTQI